MVYRDIQTAEIGIQSLESDIDHDLINEMKFYKGETARLQQELNANRMKMLQHEKNMKAAMKEKNDVNIGTKILQKQVQEARSDAEAERNNARKYQEMQKQATQKAETQMILVSKLQTTMERVQKFANHCEKLFEKMLAIDGMKEMLITEQNKLLNASA